MLSVESNQIVNMEFNNFFYHPWNLFPDNWIADIRIAMLEENFQSWKGTYNVSIPFVTK